MLKTDEIRTLRNIFNKYKDIKVVYLFGSYAANKENRLSDIDLGILLEENYAKIKLDILADLASNNFCDIDLVILNKANLLTRFEVVKHNKFIYQKVDFNSAEYFSLIVRKHLDFKPFLAVQRSYLKERIVGGQ